MRFGSTPTMSGPLRFRAQTILGPYDPSSANTGGRERSEQRPVVYRDTNVRAFFLNRGKHILRGPRQSKRKAKPSVGTAQRSNQSAMDHALSLTGFGPTAVDNHRKVVGVYHIALLQQRDVQIAPRRITVRLALPFGQPANYGITFL